MQKRCVAFLYLEDVFMWSLTQGIDMYPGHWVRCRLLDRQVQNTCLETLSCFDVC